MTRKERDEEDEWSQSRGRHLRSTEGQAEDLRGEQQIKCREELLATQTASVSKSSSGQ